MGRYWDKICSLQRKNEDEAYRLRMKLAAVCPSEGVEYIKVRNAYPDFFNTLSEEEKIPLSTIHALAEKDPLWQENGLARVALEKIMGQRYIPFGRWLIADSGGANPLDYVGVLPTELLEQDKLTLGSKLVIESIEYVVVYKSSQDVLLAPSNRVHADIDFSSLST